MRSTRIRAALVAAALTLPLFIPDPALAYGWWPPYAYSAVQFEHDASLRIQVTPREAEVFIDGYYSGTVDDFDGMFQRLNLGAGEHELTLYLEGYRTVRQKVFLQPSRTFRVVYTMEKLQAGEPQEARPSAPTAPPPSGANRRLEPPRPGDGPASRASGGTLAVRVQPADADILIDDERWQGSTGERLLVELGTGRHRVEIRREGYRPHATEVDVRRGETTTLNVSLSRE